jgi:hypothetical protein
MGDDEERPLPSKREGVKMSYTPDTTANWNIGQTVKHLLNQGIPAKTILYALQNQAEVLRETQKLTP